MLYVIVWLLMIGNIGTHGSYMAMVSNMAMVSSYMAMVSSYMAMVSSYMAMVSSYMAMVSSHTVKMWCNI